MKYIDAEKLIAEIERLIKVNKELKQSRFTEGIAAGYGDVLSAITPLQQGQLDNLIQWTGNNLKEVIDFTGKSPRFEEWFKSWDDYEEYVHSHNDILKLFCEDGSHYEVPKGAWIMRTPDGYNVASCYKFIQKSAEWSEEYREEDLQTRFAFYTYKDEDSALYLSNVFVEETSRNKGFGTKILAAAEKVAETLGAIQIRLKVKQNSPANAWYRKHGYGYITFEEGFDWLEKTLEYMKPIKSKWSEEDRDRVAQYLHDRDGGMLWSKATEITSDILDILRPQPHWKPREEQMKAFNEFLCRAETKYVNKDDILSVYQLYQLYEDLERLKNDKGKA